MLTMLLLEQAFQECTRSGVINSEYLREMLETLCDTENGEECTIAMLSQLSHSAAFTVLYPKKKVAKLYLICGSDKVKGQGAVLLQAVEDELRKLESPKITSIELDALPHVLTYYHNHSYKHQNKDKDIAIATKEDAIKKYPHHRRFLGVDNKVYPKDQMKDDLNYLVCNNAVNGCRMFKKI